MNLRFKYPKITYADLVASMGLTETPIMSPPAPGPQWPNQAYITMGNRCHGDAISPDYLAKLKVMYGDPLTSNGLWLATNQWARPMPWIFIIPGANNRCTNAGFMVYDMQMQYFSIAQQKWILISTLEDRAREWTSSYYTFDGSADAIRISRFNLPVYNCVKVAGDRAAEDTIPPTVGKYRVLHSGLVKLILSVFSQQMVSQ